MNKDVNVENEEDSEEPLTGWTQLPIMRGVFEISPVLDITDRVGGTILGGYARFCCSNRNNPIKAMDVDIFPIADTEERSEQIYEALIEAFTKLGLEKTHENNVSVSFSGAKVPPFDRCPAIQIIKPIEESAILTRGTLEEVLDNFDFTIVRIAINKDRQTATAWASFPKDEKRGLLRILNIHCPISSLLRVMKYGRKGYYMRPMEAMKLFADWQNRPQEYRERIAELFTRSDSQFGQMSQKEIDELESLLRVD